MSPDVGCAERTPALVRRFSTAGWRQRWRRMGRCPLPGRLPARHRRAGSSRRSGPVLRVYRAPNDDGDGSPKLAVRGNDRRRSFEEVLGPSEVVHGTDPVAEVTAAMQRGQTGSDFARQVARRIAGGSPQVPRRGVVGVAGNLLKESKRRPHCRGHVAGGGAGNGHGPGAGRGGRRGAGGSRRRRPGASCRLRWGWCAGRERCRPICSEGGRPRAATADQQYRQRETQRSGRSCGGKVRLHGTLLPDLAHGQT